VEVVIAAAIVVVGGEASSSPEPQAVANAAPRASVESHRFMPLP